MSIHLPRRFTIPASTLPGTPAISRVAARDSAAAITWGAVPEIFPPVSSYTVTASPGGASTTVSGTYALLTGLTNGTSYTLTVTARNSVGTTASLASSAVTPSSALAGAATVLPWAPPALTSPTTIVVSTSGGGINLSAGQDYILQMPASPVTSRLAVTGGRNIVMIGGQVAIPNQGDTGVIQTSVPVGGTTVVVDTTANWPASGTVRLGSSANENDVEDKGYSSKTATQFNLTSGTANAHPAGSGTWPTISARQCAQFYSFTGTVHVEGVDFGGADASEGMQVNQSVSPDAIYRMQNCRMGPLTQRDNSGIGNPQDNHSDAIQTIGGPRQAQLSYCTFHTLPYQGLTFQPNSLGGGTKPTDLVDIRNTNIRGTATSRYLLWQDDTPYFGEMRPSNVYMHTAGTGIHTNPSNSCWPAGKAWIANVLDGDPPVGDFCPAGVAGLNYISPGYA